MMILRAAFRLQLHTLRRNPDYLLPLAAAPLFTIIFITIMREAGRNDLLPYAVVGPMLIALWSTSLNASGEVIDADRWSGTLELTVAAPASLGTVVLGRVLAVTTLGSLSFVEVPLVSRWLLGESVTIHHKLAFVSAVGATAFAMAGTGLVMSAIFTAARSARTFQNSLSYPLYILGGVVVPTSFLPEWVVPFTKLIFLSWSADLLRSSLEAEPVDGLAYRLLALLVLGVAALFAGRVFLDRITARLRSDGTLAHS